MGDAADDVFEAALRSHETHVSMRLAKCRSCPTCTTGGLPSDQICPTCDDLGWIDEHGHPCEP